MGQNNTNSDKNDGSLNSHEMNELISALLDNEITDVEKEKIFALIESENDFKNRFEFENAVKAEIKKRVTRIETPQYVYQSIQTSINSYTEKISELHADKNRNGNFDQPVPAQRVASNRPRNFMYLFGSVAAALLLIFFSTNYIFTTNEDIPHDVNLVELSRDVFEKVETGDIKIQYATSDAKELERFFDEKLNYKVFVPDVKDAVLLGGVYNVMNGKKAAHFIHKKGDMIIYTLQLCKKDVLDDGNKDLMLTGDMKENVKEGKNWLHCPKKFGGNENIILWHKDDAISSSVSKMDPDQIHAVLTNYK
jgi:hypothetical protein